MELSAVGFCECQNGNPKARIKTTDTDISPISRGVQVEGCHKWGIRCKLTVCVGCPFVFLPASTTSHCQRPFLNQQPVHLIQDQSSFQSSVPLLLHLPTLSFLGHTTPYHFRWAEDYLGRCNSIGNAMFLLSRYESHFHAQIWFQRHSCKSIFSNCSP